METLILLVVGLAVGTIGALVGAGGGFLLVPVLLVLYPDDPPNVVTSISLGIVLVNAISASVAYARAGRIDYRTGLLLAAATVPGSVAGALLSARIARGPFTVLFGMVLMVVATLLFFRPSPRAPDSQAPPRGGWQRLVIDRYGQHYRYAFSLPRALALAVVVGLLSSLLGIGGGIIQVPLFIMLFGFPVLIATATSSFMLVVMSLSGVATHIAAGDFDDALSRLLILAPAVVIGSQVGVWLSRHMRPIAIARLLAVAMTLAAIRMLMTVMGQ